MLATSTHVLFLGHNHLLPTGTDDCHNCLSCQLKRHQKNQGSTSSQALFYIKNSQMHKIGVSLKLTDFFGLLILPNSLHASLVIC